MALWFLAGKCVVLCSYRDLRILCGKFWPQVNVSRRGAEWQSAQRRTGGGGYGCARGLAAASQFAALRINRSVYPFPSRSPFPESFERFETFERFEGFERFPVPL